MTAAAAGPPVASAAPAAPALCVLRAAEMRAADQAAIAAGTPVETLMERAGLGAVRAIEERYGTQRGFRVAVVAGKGNNAGDGFVVARHLAQRGARVEVWCVADPADLSGAARANFERLPAAVRITRFAAGRRAPDLFVDALLGTGAGGALAADYAAAVRGMNDARAQGMARTVALDLPTGLDADTGRALGGPVVEADLTVAFAHLKPAHVLWPGRGSCGATCVVDIGIEPATPAPLELMTFARAAELLPRRGPAAHKGDAGRVLVAGGSAGMTGAIVLAAMSALRAGAGLVTAGVPASVNDAIESAMIEAMTLPLPESPERALGLGALPVLAARAAEADAVAVGPGLSRAPEALEVARRLVAAVAAPLVVDADGLNAFAGRADELARRAGAAPAVLTPHLGEMARLTGREPAALEADRLTAPREAARAWNAVVVLKGAPTLVAAPDGRATVNPTGNPGMATAGMGDVLTGVIAGFLAQGLAPYDAARLGAYVHGLAADAAYARIGTLGLVAGDVTAALPQVLARLETAGRRSNLEPVPQTRIAPAPPDGPRSS